MTAILIVLLGLVIVFSGAALVLWAAFAFDRSERVSDEWLRAEERRAQVRSVGRVDHQVYIGGQLALEHGDEATARAVGAAIVDAQRGGVRG